MRHTWTGLASLVALILAAVAPAHSRDAEMKIVESTFRVEQGKATYFTVKLSEYLREGRIAGNASAKGGSGNDIRVLVLTEAQFQVWNRGGQRFPALYDSGQRRSVVLSVAVSDPGTYYIVFDNRFSALSPKIVQSSVRLVHAGVDLGRAEAVRQKATEREQRVGEALGRLIPKLQEKDRRLGTRQIQTPIFVSVVNDPNPNAFAVWPRRLVGVTTGTLALIESMSESEGNDVLAGVLAHELAHLFYRHARGDDSKAGSEAVVSGSAGALMIHPLVGLAVGAIAWDRNRRYDRMQETEADIFGIELACAAGFDPGGLAIFMEHLAAWNPSRTGFFLSHPAPRERMTYLRDAAPKLNCPRANS